MRIVVLDNCSTDNTKDVALSFDDERLEYRRNETNLGVIGNWNRAIDICDTEYLNIFHDDDRMFPWMIEKLVMVMETCPDVDIVGSSRAFLLRRGALPPKIDHIRGHIYRKNEYIKAACKRACNFLQTPTAMLRISSIKKKNLCFRDVRDAGCAPDFYFFLEANNSGLTLYTLKYPLFENRRHSSGWTETVNAKEWKSSLEKIINFLSKLNLDSDVNEFRRHFDDSVACAALGSYIMKLSKREISIKEFREKENELRSLGVRIPFKRKVKWFLKYVLWKRWLGL
jgi:glycosyltransferase involved in cell wall biosynthesis